MTIAKILAVILIIEAIVLAPKWFEEWGVAFSEVQRDDQ